MPISSGLIERQGRRTCEGIFKMGRLFFGEMERYGGGHETCFDHRDHWAGRLLLG